MTVSEQEAMDALQQALQQNNGHSAELVSPEGEMPIIGWARPKEDQLVVMNNQGEHRTVASMDDIPPAMQELGLPTNSPFWR